MHVYYLTKKLNAKGSPAPVWELRQTLDSSRLQDETWKSRGCIGQHRGRAVEGCMEEHCLTAAPCRRAAYMYHSLHTGQREMLCSLLKKCERGTGALSWSVAGITGAIQVLWHRHLGGQDTESILCEKCRREGFCWHCSINKKCHLQAMTIHPW